MPENNRRIAAPQQVAGPHPWLRSTFLLLALFTTMLLVQRPAAAAHFANSYQAENGSSLSVAAAVADAAGNSYVIGNFAGATAVLGETILAGNQYLDCLVAKLDRSGKVLWARVFLGSGGDVGARALAMDESGTVYVAGVFTGAALTTPPLHTIGDQDAFVVKLDPGTGAILWARNFGGVGAHAEVRALAAHGTGVTIGGIFTNADLTTPALPHSYNAVDGKRADDGFVIKLDAAQGSTQWAKGRAGGIGTSVDALSADGTGTYLAGLAGAGPSVIKLDTAVGTIVWTKNLGGLTGRALATDGAGGIYVGGDFGGSGLTPSGLNKIGNQDAFVVKLDTLRGDTVWARNFGGNGAFVSGQVLALDEEGVYLGGSFFGSLTTPRLNRIGSVDALVIKLDPTTGATDWAQAFGGSGAWTSALALAGDGAGRICVGGIFRDASLTTPPLRQIDDLQSPSGTTAFFIQLDGADGGTIWAQRFAALFPSGNVQILASTVDAAGNVYVTGDFAGTRTTVGGIILTRIGQNDVFVAKLNSGGTALWARNLGGAGTYASGRALAADATGIYVAGYLAGPGFTTPALRSIGGADAFVVKLDAQNGDAVWAKSFGGAGASADGLALAADDVGAVYLGGQFYGSDLTMPALRKVGNTDAFVVKLDAATGTKTWASNFGGTGAHMFGAALATDRTGAVYFGGDFENGPLTQPALAQLGDGDAFAFRLNPASGAIVWAQHFGGPRASTRGRALASDGGGGIYLGGYFLYGDLTRPALDKYGTLDAFVLKLNATGGTVAWEKHFGGPGANVAVRTLATDGAGSIYAGGDVGGDLMVPALSKIGDWDALVMKLAALNGETVSAQRFGGSAAVVLQRAMAVDATGGIYLGGFFSSANLTAPALTRTGGGNAFIFNPTYSVTCNGNGSTGGSAPGNRSYLVGELVSVPANTGFLARAGYTFAGWNTAADGSGIAYPANGGVSFAMPSADVTLYAQWAAITSHTGTSITGSGNITASFTGGGVACTLALAQFVPLNGSAASSAPPGVMFPQGLFDFTASGCTPGSTLNFTITYPQPLPPGTQYWKYGRTPPGYYCSGAACAIPHWYVLPGVTVNANTVTFSITDGGAGDDNLAPDGQIVDQGGPGVPTAVPALGAGMLVLLACVLLVAGASCARRRPKAGRI